MLKNAIIRTDFSKNTRFYACDFETTTSSIAKDHTSVWSFAVDEIGEFQPEIFGGISDFFDFCGDPYRGIDKRMYFHNLKFDGEFIIYWCLTHGFEHVNKKEDIKRFLIIPMPLRCFRKNTLPAVWTPETNIW